MSAGKIQVRAIKPFPGNFCPFAETEDYDVRIPSDMYNTLNNWEWRNKNNFPNVERVSAHVPIVPPEHRPKELKDYYIMWEAVWDLTASHMM